MKYHLSSALWILTQKLWRSLSWIQNTLRKRFSFLMAEYFLTQNVAISSRVFLSVRYCMHIHQIIIEMDAFDIQRKNINVKYHWHPYVPPVLSNALFKIHETEVFCFGLMTSSLAIMFAHHRALRNNLRIIAIDYPGIGESTYEKDRTLGGWADDVSEFLDTLNLKRVRLLGHSLG